MITFALALSLEIDVLCWSYKWCDVRVNAGAWDEAPAVAFAMSFAYVIE